MTPEPAATATAKGIVREVASSLLRSLPGYIIKGAGALIGWYFHLGAVAMFFVTCVAGVGVIVASSSVGLSPDAQASVRQSVEPVLVLALLATILLGVIRPKP